VTAQAARDPGVQNRLATELEGIVRKRIANDQLVLPSLPGVTTKCLNLLRKTDFSMKEAASLMESDPILTAQILKLANSGAYGGRDTIKSVLNAATRLGEQKLRAFLVEASARKIFESGDPRIAQASTGLWSHSIAVAVLARDLMAFTSAGDPELGYLGGLLHDIGKPVVAGMLLDVERAVAGTRQQALWLNGDEWIGVVQRCHRQVGVSIAEKWQMPDVVCRTVRDCEEYDNADRLSVANVVRFANAIAKQEGLYVGGVNKEDVDALVMIGRSLLNVDEDVVKRLTSNLAQTVRSLV
jgi:putative nucleotidyltransferase with HDIG domain